MIRETLGEGTTVVRGWDLRKVRLYVLIRNDMSYETEVMTLFQVLGQRVLGDISVGNVGYRGEWNDIRR